MDATTKWGQPGEMPLRLICDVIGHKQRLIQDIQVGNRDDGWKNPWVCTRCRANEISE